MIVDRAVGIDLGTTNSEIAVLVPSEREILIYQDKFGRRTVPSAVAWDEKAADFVVGRAARAKRGSKHGPVESIKRSMGQSAKVTIGPHTLSPEEVSGKILSELASGMRAFLAERAGEGVSMPVTRAVVTVPAYFDAPQVEATRKAGELAGLDIIGILQEPTAAAIHHTWRHKVAGGNFLVYDLGGGTFDVSILRCVGGEYQVLAIDGDNYLGGDDFDRRYAEHLRKSLVAKGFALDLDIQGDPADRRRFDALVHAAQEIKEALSTTEVLSLAKQNVLVDKAGESVSIEEDIARADYEKVIGDLVETTITCALRALEQSKSSAAVGLEDIDHVVLVGGSTRVPLVRRRVTEALASKSKAKEPSADDVDTCVALGASVHAAQIGGITLADAGARATITTPLVASGMSLKLGVRVDQAPSGANSLAITEDGNALDERPLEAEAGKILRLEVTPQKDGDAEVALSFRDGATEVAALPFVIYRGELRPRASALSRASVIAKDIGLEVVRAGRRERNILIPRGMGLPTESKHTFFTSDQSGAVVLRLLQGRMPIKTLALTVKTDVPVGTPVELTLKCDEAMRMEACALVAGQELWARIEPTEDGRFATSAEVEKLLEQAEVLKSNVWGQKGTYIRTEVETLTAGIRETIATDPAKLRALCMKLQQFIDDHLGNASDPLQPSMEVFQRELDLLRRTVYRSTAALLGLDRQGWEDRIRELVEQANVAYTAVDAPGWRRVCNEVQALRETVNELDWASRDLDDPSYLAARLASLDNFRKRVLYGLEDFVPSPAPELGQMQIAERDRLITALQEKVSPLFQRLEGKEISEPAEFRRTLDLAHAELDRIDTARERLPALGMVTERGGGTGTSGRA
ncbi:MAG: Hsp70 family protein [Polyangiaceae bacterium]